MSQGQTPAGWYHAEGDPPGTTRYWDGSQWVGDPVATSPGGVGGQDAAPGAAYPPPSDQGVAYPPPSGSGAPFGMGQPPGGMGQQLVSPMARIGGRIIDGIIWFVIGLVTSIPLLIVSVDDFIDAVNTGDGSVDVNPVLLLFTGLVDLALVVAYEVYLNVNGGGTLGKRAISARIVKEDGSALDTQTAMMRMVPYIGVQALGILTGLAGGGAIQQLLFWLIALAGLIMLFADSRRQTPWDKVGKTLVVTS